MIEIEAWVQSFQVKAGDLEIVPRIEIELVVTNKMNNEVTGLTVQGELALFGRTVATSSVQFVGHWTSRSQETFRFAFPLPRHVIEGVETIRTDDVPMDLLLRGQGFASLGQGKAQWCRLSLNTNMRKSEKEWIQILSQLGYADRWIMEIDRPRIEGFETVQQQLVSAAEAIQTRDYESAVHSCRAAWEAADPLLDRLEAEVIKEIDRLSPGEKGEPSKSERVKKLREAVRKFSQIGAHKESYVVTSEDASLCYHLTVAMFAYLSTAVSRRGKAKP